jgi:large subunit ribosomal protein L23
MNQEKLFKILEGPHISDKAYTIADQNGQIVFKVANDANKIEIKKAVEKLFNVEVVNVNVLNNKPKKRSFRRVEGKTRSWKKAYVTLAEGHDINFVGNEP